MNREMTPPVNSARPAGTGCHALDRMAVAAQFAVDPACGLSADEARARLQRHGENRMAEKAPRSRWLAFADQFRSILIVVLLAAAALAGAIGDVKDVLVILAVVLFNSLLGFWQEHRAEATLAALKKMLVPVARVRRDGRVEELGAAQLVPGDVVLLDAGDRVPADGRVLAAHNAEVAEAVLTGESHAVSKLAAAVLAADSPLGERCNMVFMNTVVTRGRIEALVTATGMDSEMGRMARLIDAAEPGPTPLQRQLDALGKRLAWIAGGFIGTIFLLGLARGLPLAEIVLTSVALAVAAIPEGLPAVVTVTLALGMRRMARRRAIVKKLSAVETLGCTTVICSDKTGTLTLNQMTARAVYCRGRRLAVSGEGYATNGTITPEFGAEHTDCEALLRAAALANDSRIRDGQLIGDPTEGALLVLSAKGGLEPEALVQRTPRIAEIPFDSAHRFMATFHHDGDVVRLCVKGAPDVLLQRATGWLGASGVEPVDAAVRARFLAEIEAMAGRALRVMAVAVKDIPASEFNPVGDLMPWVRDLTLAGLVGIIDPPRPEAREYVRLCQQAGITVKMLTGDHPLTAAAIARELGLEGETLTGAEIDAMPADELGARIERLAVFARVAPEHKVRIVQILRDHGHVVAVTGDGVNDAPALRHADIGVAMGMTGTDVAKEAATLVLTDDNFASIVRAVKEGRAIYDNIVRFLRFQLSTNMGAIQTVLGASLLGWPTPFTAIQILWINIIMDGPPAMSLGAEPARPDVMLDAPRARNQRILTWARFARLFVYGLTMAAGTLGLYRYAQPQGQAYALTLAFTTFVLFQFFNVFNARAERGSAFNSTFFRNRWLWISLVAVLALQVLVVHWPPAQAIFHTTGLRAADWARAFMVGSCVLFLDEARKLAVGLWRRSSVRRRD
jgi:P-type Ca2+ transporter type 2C